MLLAIVLQVEALRSGVITESTGLDLHGFWFHHWRFVDPHLAERLHAAERARPFTLSPLMGLPHPGHGGVRVREGMPAWIRITTLTAELSEALEALWVPQLPAEIRLGGIPWRVIEITTDSARHPWAGRVDLHELAQKHLLATKAPERWRITFATPTTFHSEGIHLPFPLPDRLIGSWLRRWWAFGTVPLPEELVDRARAGLAVSAYQLKTIPVRDSHRVIIGCVGEMILKAVGLKPWERLAVDLLVAYAFWCGSGHYTTQGMGMTRGEPLMPSR